ncbi:MAG: type I methionyl aminopeptidase [Pseudomonas fluorescens]|nr:MAG: type I methionyl aminopeptidase [Pseudomonas fluorescens]
MKMTPKNSVELQKMREAGKAAAMVLDYITPFVVEGANTLDIDAKIEAYIKEIGAVSATIGYKGYKHASCISLNDVVCHGIPSKSVILKDGDILNIDVTVIVGGFYGDTSRMYWIGNVSEEGKKLTQVTYDAMMAGINVIKGGLPLNEIGNTIDAVATPHGYGVVREYCGHGLGRKFHEDPMVLHYATHNPTSPRLRKGVTFTVEPMINTGTWRTFTESDGWTVRTADGGLSAQFEHSVAVTEDGVEILTESPMGYKYPPYL